MSNAKRKNPDWARVEGECAKKRVRGKAQVRPKSANANKIAYILSCQELTVQRLSSELSGKIPKYTAVGPRVFVPYTEDDVTFDGIKKSCLKHFCNLDENVKNAECDILATDRGPSCSNINQIPNVSLVHVRFIQKQIRTSLLYRNPLQSSSVSSSLFKFPRERSSATHFQSTSKLPIATSSKKITKSLSLSSMLKMGQTITDTRDTYEISIQSFVCTPQMGFDELRNFQFMVNKDLLGEGAFRNVYSASCKNAPFNKGKWVLKRYNNEANRGIVEDLNQTLKQHTRKAVQMTALSEYFAAKLRHTSPNSPQFHYVDMYLGEIKKLNEWVTIEQLVPGQFVKYMNNDGICSKIKDATDNVLKAECLAHFSLQESEEKLLLTDIQGCNNILTDPEIASSELTNKENEILFCVGNYCRKAIKQFGLTHSCNKYCTYAKLNELDKVKFGQYDAKIVMPNGVVID